MVAKDVVVDADAVERTGHPPEARHMVIPEVAIPEDEPPGLPIPRIETAPSY
jgi:hypothetical protein